MSHISTSARSATWGDELRAVRAELRNLHAFTHMTGATVGHEIRGVGRLVRERTPS